MRNLSFVVAFAILLSVPSMAGFQDNVPTAGTFSYVGAAPNHSAPVVLAMK